MDEEDDFRKLFFIECEENLEDLQARLDTLLTGDDDPETVNAAFRAVHSIKGGAAAFGFEDLVEFAHEFETLMDRLRSGRLALSGEVCKTLLRSADVMTGLVEAARDGTPGPLVRSVQLTAQMAALMRGGTEAAERAAEPKATDRPMAEAPPPESIAPEEMAEAEVEAEAVTVRLTPGPGFLLAGFEPVRIIRAARAYGLVSVAVEGSVPPIEDYTPGDCPLSWRMEFELDGPRSALEEYFSIYGYHAEVRFSPPAEPSAPPGLAAAEPAPAAAIASRLGAEEATAAKAGGEAGEGAARGAGTVLRSLRVDLDRVDRLVNLVGEVLIAQAALAQGVGEAAEGDLPRLRPLIETLSRQTRELQESVMAIRAQPVRSVFARLPRVVRDLCDILGKEARLVTHGEEVEVDTTVIEELTEPLMHMIRNAMDHGIETPEARRAAGKPPTGTLTLTAEQRGGRVRIVLADDGRGIDRAAVLAKARARGLVAPDETPDTAAIEALIFHPGFSTAAEVSAVSGRGVGMDVVRRKIQQLGGRCVVAGQPGEGTTFTITLPLTLAVMDGMAVRVEDRQYILPLSNVVEAIRLERARITELPDRMKVIKLRDAVLPIYSLRAALSLPAVEDGPLTAVVVDTETGGQVVVVVDDLLGQRQIVLKSLEGNVGRIDGIGGATILGDGQVALVIDVPALFNLGAHGAPPMERMH